MDVYKIGIALAMSSNHNAILSALSAQLLGVHTNVNNLTGAFTKLKWAIGGALMVSGGVAVLHTMGQLIEKTKDYSSELAKIENLGGDMGKMAASGEIAKRAFDISQRIPMSVVDLMKIPAATNSLLGPKMAMEEWENLAKTSYVLGKHGSQDVGSDLNKLIRAGELSGRFTDPATGLPSKEKIDHFLDMATRIINATHGTVNANTLFGMAQQGGVALRSLSDDGFYTQAIMAQAMGGPRAGTAYMSLWQQMAGGTMFKRTAEGMEDVGLLKNDEWHTDHGRVILDKDASMRLTKLIGKDPLDLAANLVDHFKKTGVTDPMEQMRLVMRALGRQTTQRYSSEQVANFHQMIEERERIKQGLGVDGAFQNIMNKDVAANLKAVDTAFGNLMYAIAGPNSERIIFMLQKLTAAINYMTAYVRDTDPAKIMAIAQGIGAVALGIAGLGALVLGGLAISLVGLPGIIAALIGGLVLAAFTNEEFGKWLKADSISRYFYEHVTHPIVTAYNQWCDGLWQTVTGWINTHNIGTLISGWLQEMWDKISGLFGKAAHPTNPQEFKRDLEEANKNYVPMRFNPGTDNQHVIRTALSMNIDGRTLAQAVMEQIDYLTEHNSGAAAPNSFSRFPGHSTGITS